VFVWGGVDAAGAVLASGALYDPAADSWRAVASAPVLLWPRVLATAVWTGTVVVVWGGGDAGGTTDFQTGGVYDPAANSWKVMSIEQAPSARRAPRGIWTGSRVMFWGGWLKTGIPEDKAFLYDPNNDKWSQTSNSSAPPKLMETATGFSGSSFFVYAGRPNGAGESNLFYRYQPAGDAWSTLADGPSARYGAFGSWDGSRFIAWGGRRGTGQPLALADGGRYDPAGGTWSSMNTSGAPSARHAAHRETGWAVRSGSDRTLLVGGYGGSPPLTEANVQRNGGIYNSTANSWSPAPPWPSNEAHLWGVAVWTGSELFLWGGLNSGVPTKTGERFRP
jgi:N-acetylneuraminic acid mutarotase